MLTEYKTIQDQAAAEYEINKSHFITSISRTETEEAAAAYVNSIKKKYFDATHNCSAYIIGAKGDKQKADDDGEPSGTAGRPILDVLQKQGLVNVTAVVTRYFGGIKLGTGGLIRAYGHSTTIALAEAVIVRRASFEKIELLFSYGMAGSIENYFHKNNLRIIDKEYTESVKFIVLLETGNSEMILQSIIDITADNCKINKLGSVYCDVPI